MSIQVKEFIHAPGENDAEYIRLLNEQIERQKKLLNKAMAKIRETEPKTGEWIDWLGKGNEWECSVCKCSIESHGSIAYRYCPMCGAMMNGGEEE